jgi:hypothetical protein
MAKVREVELAKVPGRIMDLGMWLMTEIAEAYPGASQKERHTWWKAQMQTALRIHAWCREEDAEQIRDAAFRRLLAWMATMARNRGLSELQQTALDLRGGCAYVCAIVGKARIEQYAAGARLEETSVWNAYADLLCGLGRVTRSNIGWTLVDTGPRPHPGPLPDPGPLALADLAARDPYYAEKRAEWDALLPRLMALAKADASAA